MMANDAKWFLQGNNFFEKATFLQERLSILWKRMAFGWQGISIRCERSAFPCKKRFVLCERMRFLFKGMEVLCKRMGFLCEEIAFSCGRMAVLCKRDEILCEGIVASLPDPLLRQDQDYRSWGGEGSAIPVGLLSSIIASPPNPLLRQAQDDSLSPWRGGMRAPTTFSKWKFYFRDASSLISETSNTFFG